MQDIRATGHRDSYDSGRSRTRQLFCAGLVAFVLANGLVAFVHLSVAVAVPAPWSFAPVSTAGISERALSRMILQYPSPPLSPPPSSSLSFSYASACTRWLALLLLVHSVQ